MAEKVKSPKEIPQVVLRQMLTLATSGFSLVAALAWNDLIRNLIDTYIKPYTAKGSGVIAQAIYALIITCIVVIVTLQLSWLEERLHRDEEDQPKKK